MAICYTGLPSLSHNAQGGSKSVSILAYTTPPDGGGYFRKFVVGVCQKLTFSTLFSDLAYAEIMSPLRRLEEIIRTPRKKIS